MPSQAEIEAAAEAGYENGRSKWHYPKYQITYTDGSPWDDLTKDAKDWYMDNAKAALIAAEAVRNRDTDRDNTGPTIEDGWTQETAPKLAPEESDASGVARTQPCPYDGIAARCQLCQPLQTENERLKAKVLDVLEAHDKTQQYMAAKLSKAERNTLPETGHQTSDEGTGSGNAPDQSGEAGGVTRPADPPAEVGTPSSVDIPEAAVKCLVIALQAALPHLEAAGDARIKELEEALDDQRKGWDESMAAVEAETLAKVRERVKGQRIEARSLRLDAYNAGIEIAVKAIDREGDG